MRTVIRYYSRDTTRPSKRLSLVEAQRLSAAGLRIAIVHEGRHGDVPENFDRACGVADGSYAATYARETIGQPAGTAVYFGIDFDATSQQIRDRILPYMQGVADGMAAAGGSGYQIGVYGSGRTCRAVLDAKLATKAWLAQSTGWGDYHLFLNAKGWALSQGMATSLAGVSCDPNTCGEGVQVGDFTLAVAPAAASVPAAAQLFVNARSGLRLRGGPGVEFAAAPVNLAFGTAVHPLRTVGGWTQVDLQGDGKADGFVSSAFLDATLPGAAVPASAPAPAIVVTAPILAPIADAVHVPELIRQGSSAAGLKQARTTAKKALTGYPTNGCAAHLSALLQQAGVDLDMTFGAGKLAHVLAERGWSPIACRSQMPGDVGVCYDNDPTPAGADHIYLVIETDGNDEMQIADNQRTADAPHPRFASGHGKTPTEYFLRAR